jgi:3-hydroxyisobutyrate dehydrogenase
MTDETTGARPGVAVLGTGRMGTAMARRLMATGHAVRVWNRTADRMAAAIEAGAVGCATAAEAVAGAEVVILSLTDATARDAVIAALPAEALTGKLVIDTSTVPPDSLAGVAAALAAKGADFVECPVGGTVAPALNGQVLGLAGGEAEAFARARPVLEALCRRVVHLGPVGNGARMKLAINLPLGVYWAVLGEVLALLEGSDIDPATAIDVLADSSGAPVMLKGRVAVLARTLKGEDVPGTFDLAGLAKDLRLAIAAAGAGGHAMALTRQAVAAYDAAIEAGHGRAEGATLARRIAAKEA